MTEHRRTKFKPKRTKFPVHVPVKIKFLKPGDKFITCATGTVGWLEYVNECRAHVKLRNNKTVKIGETEFSTPRYSDFSSSTMVYKGVR